MEDHILMIHASGLYARMTQGNSKEDVDKWKRERKRC